MVERRKTLADAWVAAQATLPEGLGSSPLARVLFYSGALTALLLLRRATTHGEHDTYHELYVECLDALGRQHPIAVAQLEREHR